MLTQPITGEQESMSSVVYSNEKSLSPNGIQPPNAQAESNYAEQSNKRKLKNILQKQLANPYSSKMSMYEREWNAKGSFPMPILWLNENSFVLWRKMGNYT